MSSPTWRRRTRRLRHGYRRVRYARHTPQVVRVVRWVLGGVVVVSIAWLAITGFLARQQLSALQHRLAEVRVAIATGDLHRAATLAKSVPAMARHAHELTTGPVWWSSAQLPYVGQPAVAIRGSTAAANGVSADVVPRLIRTAGRIDPDRLRVSGSGVDIGLLAAQAPDLAAAAAAIHRTARELSAVPDDTWLSPVNTARNQFATQLASLEGYADAAARVSRVLPTMLGQHRTQRYFIGLQNEAELRGTGGLPGAFAIATAHNGILRFERFESDLILLPLATKGHIDTGLNFGPDYQAAYAASEPTTSYVDSNVSPDFPYAARVWAAMWEKVSGQRVDGVLALDPTVLQYLLTAVGPALLPGGGVLTAANVVALTQRDQYSIFPNQGERKRFVVSVLRAAAKKLTSGSGSAVNVLRAVSLSSQQRRLLVWSRDPGTERVLTQSNYGGTLPAATRPLSAVILNNAAAGKLDYYLSRSLNYQRTGCGAMRDVVVSIELRNNAPASGLSPYVTTRLDKAPTSAKPGDSRTLLDYYTIKGAVLQSATLNGRPTTASALTASGHGIFRIDVELPRATTQTIVLHLSEPAGRGTPVIWRQPGVTPLAVQEFNQSC